ncbi:MAG: LysM peptidoglycan-binding domain-containing protein [Planctomycetaceae bacterium]
MRWRYSKVRFLAATCLLYAGCQSPLVDPAGERSHRPQQNGPMLTPPVTGAAPRDQVPHLPATVVINPSSTTTSISSRNYQVRAGESWESIARQFGVTVDRLLEENGSDRKTSPQTGDWIVIPDAASR